MQSSENRIVIACAGSGKTTFLVEEALARPDCRIAMVTYTNNNAREIAKRFGEMNGGVPRHVDVGTWFSFLLHDGARPYQRELYAEQRIESLAWVEGRSAKGVPRANAKRYYFANGEAIYSDKIAQFVVECEAASGHCVTGRLRQIYSDVFIDEFQDLAGWDLDLIEMLLQSGVRVTLVGDPRQQIYSTNQASKNTQYLGIKVVGLVKKWEAAGLCRTVPMEGSFRCNRAICDFANGLWPGVASMTPRTDIKTEHDGVFLVPESAVAAYLERFKPQVLRHSKKSNAFGCAALNFGQAKGLQFERVLIVPTGPIKEYLKSGELDHIEEAKNRLHVAITRARHSVGFVYNGKSPIVPARWQPARD